MIFLVHLHQEKIGSSGCRKFPRKNEHSVILLTNRRKVCTMETNTSTNTDPAHGAGNGTPPAHGANSTSQGDQSTSIEELKRQLAELQAKNAEYLADNQKY